ncbi:MAG: peroxide stress protein YaaA [Bacteroidales bacterium]|nr:peroxide stress protein YaaA [Bacteroidales bacterium]
MILILSPAKNLDFNSEIHYQGHTMPDFLNSSNTLISKLKKFSPDELGALMDISPKLAELNFIRYRQWSRITSPENARPAIFTFNGEVFNGLQARSLSTGAIEFAQEHLRILSGLYGILRPLDLIQPYRLEMGIALQAGKHADLYAFWGNRILNKLNEKAQETASSVLVNLASNEYAKAAKLSNFKGRVITPVFRQLKGEKLTTITIYMKKARGLMTRFILENQLQDVEALKLFDVEGYFYDENHSGKDEWVFVR